MEKEAMSAAIIAIPDGDENDPIERMSELAEAIETAPENPYLRFEFGSLLAQDARLEEAVQQLRIASGLLTDATLDADPARLEFRSSLHLMLGDYLEARGERNQARQEWENAQTHGMYGLTLIGQQVARQRLASHPAN